MQFEWDPKKAIRNLAKHGVAFDGRRPFSETPWPVRSRTPRHSAEERLVTIGHSAHGSLIVVVHVERDSRTRIISAR